jgi:hypothetical protein
MDTNPRPEYFFIYLDIQYNVSKQGCIFSLGSFLGHIALSRTEK